MLGKPREGMHLREQNFTMAGFTFIELILVIFLLSILTAIATLNYEGLKKQVLQDLVKADLNTLKAGTKAYYLKKRQFPNNLDLLLNDGLLESLPEDKYVVGSGSKYLYNTDGVSCSIWSRGPNGRDDRGAADDIVVSFGP